MKDEEFFLISMNLDNTGQAANYLISPGEWRQLLDTARGNGWTPAGTTLDIEFQFNAALSAYEVEVTEEIGKLLMLETHKTCSSWQGGYFSGDYQLVAAEDARSIGKALQGTGAPEGLLRLLALGAFRIGR
jgi:hypothetical protein